MASIYDDVAPVSFWDRVTQGRGALMNYEARLQEAQGKALGLLNQEYTRSSATNDAFGPTNTGILNMDPKTLALTQPQEQAPRMPTAQFQPDNSYFARAAQIPGYQNLAGNLASNYGAMERQKQEQGWSVNPASNQAQETQIKWKLYDESVAENKRQEAIRRAQLGVSQGHLGIAQQEFNAKYQPDGKGGFVARPEAMKLEPQHTWVKGEDGSMMQSPIPGTTKWREAGQSLDTIKAGIEGLSALETHYNNKGTFEIFDRPSAKAAEAQRQKAITAMGELSNMGVLQPGDLDRLTKQLADPTSFDPTTGNAGAIAAVKEVNNRLTDAYNAKVRAMPTLQGYHKTPTPPK